MTDTNLKTIDPEKINKLTKSVNKILEVSRIQPGTKGNVTHVSMGGNKGKFSLSKDDRKKLYKALAKASEYNIDFHIAEMPQEYGPVIFDIDLDKKKIDNSEERLYDDNMIVEIVDYYREGIKNYLDISDDQLKVCIFEKDKPTVKEFTIRDGIHGFFLDICTCVKTRHLIRNYVIKKAEESDTFKGMDKSVNEIFDKQIISSAPWLMYGCRKVDGQVYKLSKVLDINMTDFGPEDIGTQLDKVKLFSIQNKNWVKENSLSFNKDYCQELIDEEYESTVQSKKSCTIEPDENLPENKRHNIEKARVLITMLKDSRADNYIDWIRVGWALHNTDKSLLSEWVEFSQKSDKYKDDKCEDLWTTMKDSGYSIRSIAYWAKEDNPEEYKNYLMNEYNTFLKRSLDTNTYYIAKALHNKYSDRFVCTSIKNNEWYEFRNHRWVKTEHGTSLVNLICEDFIDDFSRLVIDYNQKALVLKAGSDKEDLQTKASKTQKIIDKLLNLTFKKQIMEESKNIFYETEFVKKLDDTNKHLIGFENGVYDLETEEFRAGRPDDLISMSTKVNYVPWNIKNRTVKYYYDKMNTFFSQVLTDDEVRKYFLLSLATCCSGDNKEQKFRMITGSGNSTKNGSNGKSITMSLASKAFGDYYVACPITIITRKRNASNAASPELARLKGTRIGVFQETDENETLNVGVLKELTGSDKIMVRAMYQEPFDIQVQTKFFLQCNKRPVVNARDHGTWRRVRVVEYGSRFVEDPDPTKKNEFLIDNTLETEIDKWAPYFMSYLVHLYVSEYKLLKILTEPDIVKLSTSNYKNENDSVSRFVSECIRIIPGSKQCVTETHVWDTYREWIKGQADDTLKLLSYKEFSSQLIEIIGEPKNKSKGWVGMEFISKNNEESDDDMSKSHNTIV